MRIGYLALPLALVAPLSVAKAQHPLVLERLETWNEAAPAPSADVLESAVRDKAETIYTARDTCPDSAVTIDSVKPATADGYVFGALVRGAVKNAWFVTARMPGCDDAPVRYMVMQDIDDSLKTIRVNRGTSHAWDSLIGDTLPSARLAATAALRRAGIDCSDEDGASLGVTRIASEEPDLGEEIFGIRYSGRWTEVWPIETCDRTVEVLIRFTADGDGGAFTRIPGDEIRVLP
ncbi:hypothetical protein [Pelagerythrobacter aerophilus]|uniref:Uncharacterized protein n=1 Tax=Pelagerythrobacter aerophilus TaxID=2306995 RepID=A0A418NMP5_9SPHN|nr:hypothetical protein [Pelagerythrobacter aerophilus]RIV81414.1 hypothetical protein D2V04_00410 [Pelagerythrobacter aerophilus]